MAHKLQPVAAADKKDQFHFKRPPRAVSFMRMLGCCRSRLAATELSATFSLRMGAPPSVARFEMLTPRRKPR